MRQAVLAVTDQVDFMVAYAGDPQNWKLCSSFFTCGTPMANNAGSEALTGKRDFDKAKKLIAEAGYHGEKIVILDAVDTPVPHSHALIAADLLRKIGSRWRLRLAIGEILPFEELPKSPSTRAAGISLARAGSAPICWTRPEPVARANGDAAGRLA